MSKEDIKQKLKIIYIELVDEGDAETAQYLLMALINELENESYAG